MSDPVLDDLLAKFVKAAVSGDLPGVTFRGKGLKLDSEDDCKDIIAAIKKSPEMTYLDLEGNTLGVEAAKAIGDALKDKPDLKRALWKDMFTGRMKTEIPKALKFLSDGLTSAGAMLTELDLSDNAFGPIGVEALADLLQSRVCFSLQELRLNNNGLGITGGKMLAKALLTAHANSSEAGQPIALKTFIAGRNRLENDGAAALSNVFKTMGTLEEISMPQNGIYYKGISMISDALTYNPNLRLLDLNDNTLTAVGAKSLAEALPSLQKLQIVNLGDCLLKTKGAVILADALTPQHTHLEELILDSNEIRIDGGLALARALKNKTKIKKLSLQGNEFGEEGRISLKSEIQKLQTSDVLNCPSEDDASDASDEGEDDEGSMEECETEEEESSDEDGRERAESPPRSPTTPVSSPRTLGDPKIAHFLANPSPSNFASLMERNVETIFESLMVTPNGLDLSTCLELIMSVSNLGSNENESVKKQSRDVAIGLYKALFTWADSQQQLSAVNNMIFVYLQLIKDEDKALKVNWDVDRCVRVLQAAIVEKIVPSFTQHILTCCLERKFKNKSNEQITVT